MRMLDLFCGRGGWTDAFLARGWEVVGVDIVRHPDYRGEFIQRDVLEIGVEFVRSFDFSCCSSPCEGFSVFGMRHFHPNPPHPELGIQLFNHSHSILEAAGIPYVMENVRAAQAFVGRAAHRCGPFYLWGNAVPALMPQGITKGFTHDGMRDRVRTTRKESIAAVATIPPELANCVADYAELITQL